ncbi:LADA_0C07008g1_1 [Lachancea dasiensis]|uniref:LADA_0C07008g1_1 n=1 Tax=Lachancea dasiensis TaxID=1072105 RepID=A0A1G4IZJ9_9SACH|nr:LADA_0C07008g1_1 [Lachancea dasiensis]
MVSQESLLNNRTINVQKTCVEAEGLRVKAAKIGLVSSVLGSELSDANHSASKWKQEAQSLFGLKRLVRAYFKSGKLYARGDHSVSDDNIKPRKHFKSPGKHLSDGTMIKVCNRLPQKRQIHSISVESLLEHRKNVAGERISRMSAINGTSEGLSSYHDHKTARGATIHDFTMVQKNTVPTVVLQGDRHDPGNRTDRILQLQNLPKNCGLRSLISQIHGGPLEKIQFITEGQDRTATRFIQLHFTSTGSAQSFMRYAQAKNFQVNGCTLAVEWAPKANNKLLNVDVTEIGGIIDEKLISNGSEGSNARRCIIVKKTVDASSGRSRNIHSRRHGPCKFDVKDLREDFEKFGDIVEITPMISRKLCVSISYFDIKSAIDVLQSYENPNSYMNKKYNREWSISYGRDITETPCYMRV